MSDDQIKEIKEKGGVLFMIEAKEKVAGYTYLRSDLAVTHNYDDAAAFLTRDEAEAFVFEHGAGELYEVQAHEWLVAQ